MKHFIKNKLHLLYRYVITAFVLVFVTACSPPWGPTCLEPGDIGVEIVTVEVDAFDDSTSPNLEGGQWVDSGFILSSDSRVLSIKTKSESVQVCQPWPPTTAPVNGQNGWNDTVVDTTLWYVMDHVDEGAVRGFIQSGNWDPLSSQIEPIPGDPVGFGFKHLPYNSSDQINSSNLAGGRLQWTQANYEPDQQIRAGESINIRIDGRFSRDLRSETNYDRINPLATATERATQSCSSGCPAPATVTRGEGLRGELIFESGQIVTINFDFLANNDPLDDYCTAALIPNCGINPPPRDGDADTPDVTVRANINSGEAGGVDTYFVAHQFVLDPKDGNADLRLRHYDTWDNDYSNNSEGYRIRLQFNGCTSEAGNYLYVASGTQPPVNNSTRDLWELENYVELEPDGRFVNRLTSGGHISQGQPLWFKVIEPVDYDASGNIPKDYLSSSNSGTYIIELINVTGTGGGFTVFQDTLGFVFTTMREILTGDDGSGTNMGYVERFYRGTVTEGGFVRLIRYIAIIYISFAGVMFATGMVRYTAYEFVVRVFKISLLLTLISPSSWEFFSEYFLNIFIYGIGQMATLMSEAMIVSAGQDNTSAYDDTASMRNFESFVWADNLMGPFFEKAMWSRILALLFTGPLAIVYMLIIITAIFRLFFIIIEAGVHFLYSVVLLTFLMALAPLFIVSFMFSWTRPIFDKWVSMSFAAALTPVMIVIVAVFFSEILRGIAYELLNFSVCWACVLEIYIPLDQLWDALPKMIFCIFKWWVPWAYDSSLDYGGAYVPQGVGGNLGAQGTVNTNSGPATAFVLILMFYIFLDLFDKFVNWSVELTSSITGDFFASSQLNALASGAMQATGIQAAKQKTNSFMNSSTRRVAVGSVKALSVYGQFQAAKTGAKLLTENGRKDIAARASLSAQGASVKLQRAGRQAANYKQQAGRKAVAVTKGIKAVGRGIHKQRRNAVNVVEDMKDRRKYNSKEFAKKMGRDSEAVKRSPFLSKQVKKAFGRNVSDKIDKNR